MGVFFAQLAYKTAIGVRDTNVWQFEKKGVSLQL